MSWPPKEQPSRLLVELPAASSVASGTKIRVSNIGVSGIELVSNGTRWSPYSGHAVLYRQTGADITLADNAVEQLGFVTTIPLGLIQANDILRLTATVSRTTLDTDEYQIRQRLGIDSAGLTGTQIKAVNLVAATGNTNAAVYEYQLISATSIRLSGQDGGESYNGTSAVAVAAAVPITDILLTQLYFSLNVIKTTDTLAGVAFIRSARLEWVTG